MSSRSLSVAVLLGVMASAAFGQFTFTSLDNPAGSATQPFGINDLGQIVGYYIDGSGYHGFLYSSGNFTKIDEPSATGGTFALGINNAGQIVGFFFDGTNDNGFLYSGGSFTTVDFPSEQLTVAVGINDAGQISGYIENPGKTDGFLDTAGSFAAIDDPLAVQPYGTSGGGIK